MFYSYNLNNLSKTGKCVSSKSTPCIRCKRKTFINKIIKNLSFTTLYQVVRPQHNGKTSQAQLLLPSSMTVSPSPPMFLPGETNYMCMDYKVLLLNLHKNRCLKLKLLYFSHNCSSCYLSLLQVLVSRLPSDTRDCGFGHAAVQRADLCALHG